MEEHGKQLTVAIVDDDESVLDAVKTVLEDQDWIANTYSSGEAFLADYKQLKPDCLILDSRLPGMSGLEVASKIRDSHNNIPIIVLTAYPNTPQTLAINEVSASELMVKPVSAMALIERVEKLVSPQKITH